MFVIQKNSERDAVKAHEKCLTLKMPRKTTSENVCCIFLQTFQNIFAYRQTVEEQSDLGPHCLQK